MKQFKTNNFSGGIQTKKNKFTWLFFKLSLLFVLISFAVYGGMVFYNTHDFRSPILFQNPIPKKQLNILSPTASRSAFLQQTYAEVPRNPYDENSPKGIAWKINSEKFSVRDWNAWDELITQESGWNPYSINRDSGACGIPQSLPCSKMKCDKWDYKCQLLWMADYIENRYGNPTKALAFHQENNYY